MKKLFAAAFIAALVCAAAVPVYAEAAKLPDFSDNFESYAVNGSYIENDTDLTAKWDNNVFRGGEALGMDAHTRNVGKIEYENGDSGNKVLHLKNTTGANTYFYMGPNNDYRVKNYDVSFRVKFLTEDVPERSWVGISFRKRANSHYSGTNNLLFFIQRYAASNIITGHAYAVFGGGSETDLSNTGGLYGDKLQLERNGYTVPDATANEPTPWVNFKLSVENNRYRIYVNDALVTDCVFDVNNFDYYGYLSLNCCTANVLVDDFTVKVNDTELPPAILPLAKPVVTFDEATRTLTWESVENAYSYSVKYGKIEKIVADTEYTLPENLKAGTYQITVTALSEDYFIALDSVPSDPISYTVAGKTPSGGSGGCRSAASAGAPLIAAVCLGAAMIVKRRKKQ